MYHALFWMKTKRPERIRLGSISVIILMLYERFLFVALLFTSSYFSPHRISNDLSKNFWFVPHKNIAPLLLLLFMATNRILASVFLPFEMTIQSDFVLAIFLCVCEFDKINASEFSLFWQFHFDFLSEDKSFKWKYFD